MKKLEIGKKYWRLTILWEGWFQSFPSWQRRRLVECLCNCWNIHKPTLQKVKSWETTSCGCLKTQPAVNREAFNKWDKIWPFIFIQDKGLVNNKRRVEVKCFCWKQKETTAYVAKNSVSCGCHRKSKKSKEDAERSRLISSKRRAEIRTSSDWTITHKALAELMFLQFNSCTICAIGIAEDYHIDHIQPLADWWEHTIHNIQLLCPSCNLKKSDWYDW